MLSNLNSEVYFLFISFEWQYCFKREEELYEVFIV